MTITQTPPDLSVHAGSWILDPARTTVRFTTRAMWVVPVKGTVQALEGTGTVTPDGAITGRLVLDAASVASGITKRDEHVRTADFFDVATHPTWVMDVTGGRPTGPGAVELTGTLTMHGVTRPLVLAATIDLSGAGMTVTLDTHVDRSEWGVGWHKMGAGVVNHVTVAAVFTRV